MGKKSNFSNSLLTEDQIEVKAYTRYLVWYIFTSANLNDQNICIKYELMPLILHFEVKNQ